MINPDTIVQAIIVATLIGFGKWCVGAIKTIQKDHLTLTVKLTEIGTRLDGHINIDKLKDTEQDRRIHDLEKAAPRVKGG